MKRNSGHALKFLAVSLAGTGVFYIWAFGIVLKNSFITEWAEHRFGIGNYLTVLQNKAFWIASKVSETYLCSPGLSDGHCQQNVLERIDRKQNS